MQRTARDIQRIVGLRDVEVGIERLKRAMEAEGEQ